MTREARIPIDLAGRRFGRLQVLRIDGKIGSRNAWLCLCDCGIETRVATGPLKGSRTLSCGCLQKERARATRLTHGGTGTRAHRIWRGMLRRCLNENDASYHRYGGRGIGVCDRWRESFANFLADMGEPPSPKHTLERINNSIGYQMGNCRWATVVEQANNRRNNRVIEHQGQRRTMTEWARKMNISPLLLATRLHKGWSFERAIKKKGRSS